MSFVEFKDKDGHRIFINTSFIVRVVASESGTCLETSLPKLPSEKYLMHTIVVQDDIDTAIKKLTA